MATPVLLLRAPTSPPETDRYETALRSAGFHPVSVPVLETALANIHGLSELLAAGPQDVGGVIVTSARAAEAWANAVESVAHLDNGGEGIIPPPSRSFFGTQATHSLLQLTGLPCRSTPSVLPQLTASPRSHHHRIPCYVPKI